MMQEHGFTSYKAKTEKVIGQATYKKIMQGGGIDTRTIARFCEYFGCQPGDLMEYDAEKKENNPEE